MEQKTNPRGQQTAPKAEPTAWLQEVTNMATAIGEQLNDKADHRRAFMVIAVERDDDDEEDYNGQTAVCFGGNSISLALAIKEVLTGKSFAPHIAHAVQLIAGEAPTRGKGTIAIKIGDFDDLEDEEADGE